MLTVNKAVFNYAVNEVSILLLERHFLVIDILINAEDLAEEIITIFIRVRCSPVYNSVENINTNSA